MSTRGNLLITLIIFALPGLALAQPYDGYDQNGFAPQPVRSATCIVEGTFSCAEHVYTYSVHGLSCTEDCLAISNLNTCQLNNRCNWEPASGCFMKDICVEISDLNTCRRWETHPICGG